LLKFGYAWLYGQYCKKDFCRKWRDFETRAKINKVDLWGDPHAQPPWDYKRSKKSQNKAKVKTTSGIFHDNVKSRIFHHRGADIMTAQNALLNLRHVMRLSELGIKRVRCVGREGLCFKDVKS